MDYFEDSSQIMKGLLEQRQVQSSDTLLVSLSLSVFFLQASYSWSFCYLLSMDEG